MPLPCGLQLEAEEIMVTLMLQVPKPTSDTDE
jgi:hypothetical protein